MIAANRIKPLLQSKFGKVKTGHGKNGVDLIIDCPFCGKKQKCYVTPSQGIYHCFRCGDAGSIEKLIGHSLPKTFNSVGEERVPVKRPQGINDPGELVELTQLGDDHPGTMYLRQRGFSPKELNDKFGVRYCTRGKIFANVFNTSETIVFPLWMFGKLVGWQARLLYTPDGMDDAQCAAMGFAKDPDGDWIKPPKYWTAPGMRKGTVLLNFDNARQSNVVVVCEGPFDAAAVGRCAVATLGKAVTEEQAQLLASYWDLVVILLDPGDADRDMQNLEMRLNSGCSVQTLRIDLKGYKDAGETPRLEIWRQIYLAAAAKGIALNKYRILT